MVYIDAQIHMRKNKRGRRRQVSIADGDFSRETVPPPTFSPPCVVSASSSSTSTQSKNSSAPLFPIRPFLAKLTGKIAAEMRQPRTVSGGGGGAGGAGGGPRPAPR